MLILKKLLMLSIFIVSISAFGLENRVGYIEMQRAIQSTNAGQKAKSDLDKEFSKRKASLDKRKADIEKSGQDLEKKGSILSEEALGKKQADLQAEMVQFQKQVNDSQLEMQKMQGELLQPILDKMQKAVERVATARGYSIVLEKSERNVVFAAKDVDVTDAAIKEFESMK